MTNNLPPWVVRHRGLSLLELTVVIATISTLISVFALASRAWRRGNDRAGCVLALRNLQVATRSYQHMYHYEFGGHPYAENGSQNIAEHLFAKGYIEENLHRQTRGLVACSGGGNYSVPVPDRFPPVGRLYMECSLARSESHEPVSHADW